MAAEARRNALPSGAFQALLRQAAEQLPGTPLWATPASPQGDSAEGRMRVLQERWRVDQRCFRVRPEAVAQRHEWLSSSFGGQDTQVDSGCLCQIWVWAFHCSVIGTAIMGLPQREVYQYTYYMYIRCALCSKLHPAPGTTSLSMCMTLSYHMAMTQTWEEGSVKRRMISGAKPIWLSRTAGCPRSFNETTHSKTPARMPNLP